MKRTKPLRLLVSGAGSFLAQPLLKACAGLGHEIFGFDLAPPDRPDCITASITDPELFRLLPKDYDVAIHLAALARDSDCRRAPEAAVMANVVGTLNVLEAAVRCGIRRVVFVSTEWVYDGADAQGQLNEDTPIDLHALESPYGQSKLYAEAALRQTASDLNVNWTVLRLGIVYGPRAKNWGAVESLLSKVMKGQPIEGCLQTARRYIDVRDVAAALLAAADSDYNGILNIQGPRLVSLSEILDIAADLTGQKPMVSERDFDNPNIRNIDSSRAGEHLNWQPSVNIRTGMITLHNYLSRRSAA